MGAPDYTTAEQNARLLAASELQVEPLAKVASAVDAAAGTFTVLVPTHSSVLWRLPLWWLLCEAALTRVAVEDD